MDERAARKRTKLQASLGFGALLAASQLHAQVVMDGSLGSAGALSGPHYAVTASLGRQVGGNLFHSFGQFSLSATETATFSGPASVGNIISRVTGGIASTIDGKIVSSIAGANFYFLNPSGIFFGAHATLDISGASYFSTAHELRFADNAVFSASTSAASTLTLASPTEFGFLGSGAELSIAGAQLAAQAGKSLHFEAGTISITDSQITASASGSQPPGAIRIVGGRITLENSVILSDNTTAAAAGELSLEASAALEMTNSRIESTTAGTGNGAATSIHADNIWLDGSLILNDSWGAGMSGAVSIRADNDIVAYGWNAAGDGSHIGSDVYAAGNAGAVTVSARNIDLWDGAQIRSISFDNSSGAGGAVKVDVSGTAYFSGVDFGNFPSGILSESYGYGNAGNIELNAGTLLLRDGGIVSTSTFGELPGAGNAGNITIKATETIELSGVYGNERPSLIRSDTWGSGYAGSIMVTAPIVNIFDGAQISSTSYGTLPAAGAGGYIDIQADNYLFIDGVNPDDRPAGVFAETKGPGMAGSINVEAGDIYISNGGQIRSVTYSTAADAGSGGFIALTTPGSIEISGMSSDESAWKSGVFANTDGMGSAGSIWIEAGQVTLNDGGQIMSTTTGTMAGAGAGGMISLEADSLKIAGIGAFGSRNPSGIFTESYGPGSAGFISLTLGRLELSAGGEISTTSFAATEDSGAGGYISIVASDQVRITGAGDTGYSSGIFADTYGAGAGGFISIQADNLEISNGAEVVSTTRGTQSYAGDGGFISIDVAGSVLVEGLGPNIVRSGIYATTNGPGQAGFITLTAQDLQVLAGGQINSSTYGTMSNAGAGGYMFLETASMRVAGTATGSNCSICPSVIAVETSGPGSAGNILLNTGSLSVTDGGIIGSSTYGEMTGAGSAGFIEINATGSVTVSGINAASGEISQIVSASHGPGTAGNILLSGHKITFAESGYVSSTAYADTEHPDEWGSISVTADTLRIEGDRSGIFTNTEGNAYAGDIFIDSHRLELAKGGLISSSALGEGADARGEGIISIASDSIRIAGIGPDLPSGIYTESWGPGSAGSITLTTNNLTLSGGGLISSAAMYDQSGAGDGGNIIIYANNINMTGTTAGWPASINAESFGPGTAGSIEIHANTALKLTAGAQIATRTDFSDGGNITVRAGEMLKVGQSSITTSVGSGFGNGGNIDIDPRFVVLNSGLIQANAYGGNGGNIRVISEHLIATPDSRIEASSELGVDGNIEISSPNVDVGSGLTVLPSHFLDASLLLRSACAAGGRAASSSFVGAGNGGLPAGPDSAAASRYDMFSATLVQAELLQSQGKRLDALRQAMALAGTADAPELKAVLAGALGKAYLLAAMPADARRQLAELIEQARQQDLPALESAALNDLGLVEWLEGHPQDSAQAFAAARAAALKSGTPLLAARAALNAGRLQLRNGATAEARTLLIEAAQHLAQAPDTEDKAYQQIAVGRLLRQAAHAADKELVVRLLTAAARSGRHLDLPRVESFAIGELGELYERQGRAAEAIELARRALFLAQQANAPDALYRWHWLVARIQAQRNRSDAAIAAYERALASLQEIRQDLMAELRIGRESYRAAIGPLFQEYVDLLLRRAVVAQPAARRELLLAARNTFEKLKTVELEDYFQDACVSAIQSKKSLLDDALPGTAILYPILLADRVELLVSLPGEIRQVRLDVATPDLIRETEHFRRMLEKRTTREFLPAAQKLHQWLLAPIEEDLRQRGIDTLVFVPDGPLRGIPLAALHDGKAFVIERYAVAVAPGLSMVEESAQGAQGTQVRKSLLGGITESVQNFPALPYVEPEMQSIRTIYAGKSLTDAQFVIPSFENEMRNANYSIVHIASHGQIESDPRKSFLLAYDGKITMDDLEGYMKYSRLREEGIDLLTLSACRTAAGDERAALGLAGVAVKAGARSALATLWYVSDQASSMLVTHFYRVLSVGKPSKAQALRAAQRAVLADPRYRHPGYWAPFLLIGNWR